MIDSQTEVIFLDEAHAISWTSMTGRLYAKGLPSHDVKWKKAEGFHCRASMYITCQKEIDFESKAVKISFQEFTARGAGGQQVASRARYGLHCMGPKVDRG